MFLYTSVRTPTAIAITQKGSILLFMAKSSEQPTVAKSRRCRDIVVSYLAIMSLQKERQGRSSTQASSLQASCLVCKFVVLSDADLLNVN